MYRNFIVEFDNLTTCSYLDKIILAIVLDNAKTISAITAHLPNTEYLEKFQKDLLEKRKKIEETYTLLFQLKDRIKKEIESLLN